MNSHAIIFDCSSTGLDEQLALALKTIADSYYDATGEPIVVTAGKRTLQRQAELMANFSKEQLEAMYCRHGYPSYISQILALPNPHDAVAVHHVLANRTEGYISKHLYGQAVDIDAASISSPILFKQICNAAGLSVLDERENNVPCFHLTMAK